MKKLALVVAVIVAVGSMGATISPPITKDLDPLFSGWIYPGYCNAFVEASRIPVPPNLGNGYCTACTRSLATCEACSDRVDVFFGSEAAWQNRYVCEQWYAYGGGSALQS